jgi:hypothetical protein
MYVIYEMELFPSVLSAFLPSAAFILLFFVLIPRVFSGRVVHWIISLSCYLCVVLGVLGCGSRIVRRLRSDSRRWASVLDSVREQRSRRAEPESQATRSAVRNQNQGQRVRDSGDQVRARIIFHRTINLFVDKISTRSFQFSWKFIRGQLLFCMPPEYVYLN